MFDAYASAPPYVFRIVTPEEVERDFNNWVAFNWLSEREGYFIECSSMKRSVKHVQEHFAAHCYKRIQEHFKKA